MTPHAPGVYFGLPQDEYLADPSLSFSGMKQMMASPLTYWASSWMNEQRVVVESDAMALGTLVHKRVLEGAESFESQYAIAPAKEDYPTALHGAEAMKDYCKMLGIKVSGTIAEMSARILEADPTALIWSEIQADFNRRCTQQNKKVIAPDLDLKVRQISNAIGAVAKNAFVGGHPEVSVFWIDDVTGVPLKARIDYLKSGSLIDLKTFSNTNGLPVAKAVAQAVGSYRYHVQAVVYLTAVERAKQFFKNSQVFLHHEYQIHLSESWSISFSNSPTHRFYFVFAETGPAINVLLREFAAIRTDGDETLIYQTGLKHFRKSVETFERCRRKFGVTPWIVDHEMRAFADEEFPLWVQE